MGSWYEAAAAVGGFAIPTKPGTVTIPGGVKKVLHPKTWNSILKQAGISKERR